MQVDLFEHFASYWVDVFLENWTITLTDKTDGAYPTRREEYWRRVLKTVSPYVLNTANRSSILFPGLYIFFRGKGVVNVKRLTQLLLLACSEEPSGGSLYHMETS